MQPYSHHKIYIQKELKHTTEINNQITKEQHKRERKEAQNIQKTINGKSKSLSLISCNVKGLSSPIKDKEWLNGKRIHTDLK